MAGWAGGALAWRRDELARAERELVAAVGGLAAINPFDTALCALDVTELLLATGRTAEAIERSACMARLLEPLAGNRIAGAAVLRLTGLARQGAVDLAAIEAARRAIAGGRRHGVRPPAWRCPSRSAR